MSVNEIVRINCEAVAHKLRAIYFCAEWNVPSKLRKLAKLAHSLELCVSTKFPCIVFNPTLVSENVVNNAFDDDSQSVQRGKLLGYPAPGDEFQVWWVAWQVRKTISSAFISLFHFQMKKLNTKALIHMKERWNKTMPIYYFDFQIRYRKNKTYIDIARR